MLKVRTVSWYPFRRILKLGVHVLPTHVLPNISSYVFQSIQKKIERVNCVRGLFAHGQRFTFLTTAGRRSACRVGSINISMDLKTRDKSGQEFLFL